MNIANKDIELYQAFDLAVRQHKIGNLTRAEVLYQRVLAREPRHADAMRLLGVVAAQTGRIDRSVELILRAIEIRPDFVEAICNLGHIFESQRRDDEAIAQYRKALVLQPNVPEAYNGLGNALRAKGSVEEAIACYRQAVALVPDFIDALESLGLLLRDKGDFDGAMACHRKVIARSPNHAPAHNHLGNALHGKTHVCEAIAMYRKAIDLKPDFVEAYENLGSALRDMRSLDDAIAYSRAAIAINPDSARSYGLLGLCLKDSGDVDAAIRALRKSLALNPADSEAGANLILALHYHPDSTSESILEEAARWASIHAEPFRHQTPAYGNNRDPDRRLRIGYVSSDLKQHPVGRFILPLLIAHDRREVEVFCYAGVAAPDAMTHSLRSHADRWRSMVGLSDQQVDEMIRNDQIDILVDLGLHTGRNRLRLFARRPAPLQLTYLAYCSTSGMSAMDYRITDPYLDARGPAIASSRSPYSERSIYLPETYWCYQPRVQTPPGPLPAMSVGHITFGSLNNFCKVSWPALKIWSALLRAVPNSCLTLHCTEGAHRNRVIEFAAREGIAPERFGFVNHVVLDEYFDLYRGIDICLDPFPFSGGTTTCDALWMGVPVVTLVGDTAVGRGGLSILSNVGLAELAARSPQEYLQIAAALASDPSRLAEYRSTLRQRMLGSPLMDIPRFARNLEEVYRTIWQEWSASKADHGYEAHAEASQQ